MGYSILELATFILPLFYASLQPKASLLAILHLINYIVGNPFPSPKTATMKIALLLLPVILFASCGNEQTEATAPPEVQVKAAAAPIDPAVQKLESLKAAAPMGLDELSAFLPSKLGEIRRSNVSMSSNMGYGMAHADYEKNSRTDIRVTLYDCSGAQGADIYESIYASKLDKNREDSSGFNRTIDFNGGKAIEQYSSRDKVGTLTYMPAERVLAVLTARNIEPEALLKAAADLKKK